MKHMLVDRLIAGLYRENLWFDHIRMVTLAPPARETY